jgi:ankyrin repeat protein
VTKKIEGEVEVILSCKDKDGQTPLHIASKVGCTGIINLIRKWEKSRKGENR